MEKEDQHNSKELCLVVLGGIESGRTSLVNSLLGKTDIKRGLRTINCIRHHGQLNGRQVTVVHTPGWWKDFHLIDTAQRTKDELVLSVRQCPPGPHAFILAVEVATFNDRNKRAVEEHLNLFGDYIWSYTIMVFTRGEYLKGRTIEQHIESEGVALKMLVDKCGNRYCVFDNQTTGQDQVFQLLEAIERLVDHNCGRHFQLNDKTLREVEERRRAAQERASLRQLQVQDQRNHLRDQGTPRLTEVRIVMLGWVVSGKSSARNTILNKDEYAPLSETQQCERETAWVGDRHVTVVDTPGWWKYFSAKYTPEQVKTELKKSISLGSKSPNALLIVVPAEVSFLEEQRKITEDHMNLMFGQMFVEMAWRHTMVLFTRGDSLGNTSIEEHIENEGEPLRWLVEKCENRYHVFDNVNRGDGSQVRQLLEKIDELEASLAFCYLPEKAPKSEITPIYGEDNQTDVVEVLDKEWNKKDKELEEKVTKLWHEAFGSAWKGDNSMHRHIQFSENEVSSETGVQKGFPGNLPRTKSSEINHPSEICQKVAPPSQSQIKMKENIPEKFEREWGRCKAIIMDRVHRTLFPELYASGTAQAEHEPHKYMSRELEEWHRHEDVVMERVQTLISELCSQSVFSSEPDEEEYKQAIQKVLLWQTQTSGLGFEENFDENDYEADLLI